MYLQSQFVQIRNFVETYIHELKSITNNLHDDVPDHAVNEDQTSQNSHTYISIYTYIYRNIHRVLHLSFTQNLLVLPGNWCQIKYLETLSNFNQ